jgi:hypothetical protein
VFGRPLSLPDSGKHYSADVEFIFDVPLDAWFAVSRLAFDKSGTIARATGEFSGWQAQNSSRFRSLGELVLNELATSPESDELREMFEQSRQRILSILDDAMLLTQIDVEREMFPAAPVDSSLVLKRAVETVLSVV